MPNIVGHFVGGSFIEGEPNRKKDIFNPATGVAEKVVHLASADEVKKAIACADKAWPAWRDMPPLRRARILDRFKTLLWNNLDNLAKTITLEHGKTLEDAKGEVMRGIEVVEFAVGIPNHLKGDFSENIATEVDSISVRQPLGVVAGITPFNFPIMVPMWMFPVALACGNCFVLKPSERDPSSSIFLARLLQEAGLPDGVFNVIQGDKEAVDTLLTDERIKAVSFVGSTPIAKYVYNTGTVNSKRVQALGGAKNHMVIMPDADMEMTANALIGAAFGSAGERCMAISVAVPVGEETAKSLLAHLAPKVKEITVGSGLESKSDMGPLITKEHLEKVTSYIDKGEKEGAELLFDGRTLPKIGNGFFTGPTLFDKVTKDMSIYKDEIFGPVLSIVRCSSYDDAVNLIHGHEYANGVAIFTRDGGIARDFSNRINVGMVGVNIPIPVPMAFHSFGGWKSSIFGDHAIYGAEGVRFYTKIKTTTIRWPKSSLDGQGKFFMPVSG